MKSLLGPSVIFVLTAWMFPSLFSCTQPADSKPSAEILKKYSTYDSYTDPGEYAFLYKELPASPRQLCDLIKKQLIHPVEARQMKELLPQGRAMEDVFL